MAAPMMIRFVVAKLAGRLPFQKCVKIAGVKTGLSRARASSQVISWRVMASLFGAAERAKTMHTYELTITRAVVIRLYMETGR